MSYRTSDPNDLERRLSAWFEADSHIAEPDDLLANVVARTKRSRRIPGWLLPERWIPMQLTARFQPVPRLIPIFLLLVALVIAAVAAVALLGSPRHLPAPFGFARNGQIAYINDGHVWIADATGLNGRQVTSGAGTELDPMFSRDGTRLAYRHLGGPADTVQTADVTLANADGSNVIVIARDVKGLSHVAWSPDGRSVAFSGSIDGGPENGWIAPSDGSAPPRVFTSLKEAWDPTWSPDGKRLVVGAVPAQLWAVGRDGSNPMPLLKGSYPEIGQRGEIAEWNPAGTLILFTAGEPGGPSQVYLVGLDGKPERQLSHDTDNASAAVFSPDGTQIAYMRKGIGLGPVAVVTDLDGKILHVMPGYYGWFQPIWSPDGTKLIVTDDRPGPDNDANLPAVRVILDVAGKAPPVVIPAPGITPNDVPDWAASWQRLAP